jgi:hypothetical protein
MHSVSDAPHREQRCFAFPKPANDKSPRPLYILPDHAMPSVIDRIPHLISRRDSGANRNQNFF